jgi:ABC-2 type transport system permease protein
MRVFIAVLKNNFRRLMEQKQRLLLFPILTAASIAGAIFFNTKADIAGNIAVVAEIGTFPSIAYLNVTQLEQAPTLSELLAGRYDAVVVFDDQGGYEIQTIKSDEFKQILSSIISDPSANHAGAVGSRGKGTNIVGFILMFVMMQGVSLMFMFAEDKEKKQIRRVAASPVSFTWYLCAQSFFTFTFLFIPIAIMLSAAYVIPGIDMGFSLATYLLLAALQCALATSFGLFLVALFKKSDSSNMIGSASVVLTSVLAGSFYSFDKGNKVLETIIKVLPQKAFLSMSDSLERGLDMSAWFFNALYITAFVAVFILIAVVKTRKDYVKN